MSLPESLDLLLRLDDGRTRTRDEAFRAILVELAAKGLIQPNLVDALRDAITRRDELGPTAIGEGVAIPHAWHPDLDRMAVALAVSPGGLDYPSLDGEPVHIVLLVLTPPKVDFERPKQQILDLWLRHLRDPAFRSRLRMAANHDALLAAIQSTDTAAH